MSVMILFPYVPLSGQIMIPRPEDLYNEAEEYVFAGEYQEALPLYTDLYNKGHTTANISYKIGTCYLNLSGLRTKAIPFLKDAAQHASLTYTGTTLEETHAPVKSFLYLGIAYRINYNFELAENAFLNYIDLLDETDETNRALAQYHMERCENARELIASPVKLHTDTVSDIINNVLSNFNPLVTDDEKMIYYNEQLKFYDAVMQSVREDGIWSEPENITPKIRSDGDHYLTGVSLSGDRLLLSAHDPYMSGEIYVTEYENGRWKRLQLLNSTINTQFNETHASFSGNGNTIFFTSDRPGGYGGLDIYKSERDTTGEWGSAQNLGPIINTPYNEETPFVAGDPVMLFFSSQGHYNMGGYDIFCSQKLNHQAWQYPVNVGYPVNTPDDDLFYYPLPSGNAAYKSVFYDNSTNLDIIRYQVLSPANPARFSINGRIMIPDQNGFDPSDVLVSVINRTENDTVGYQHPDDDGAFRQKVPSGSFTLEITDKGYPVYSRELEIPSYLPQNELMLTEAIAVQTRMIQDTIILQHITFGFDESNISSDARIFLDSLALFLKKHPEILVTLNGYTDAIGPESYNRKLSLERAGNTRDYLYELNIEKNRLSINGFGEDQPVAINVTSDGRDSPEGRKFNRRVEVILKNTPDNLIVIRTFDVPENLRLE